MRMGTPRQGPAVAGRWRRRGPCRGVGTRALAVLILAAAVALPNVIEARSAASLRGEVTTQGAEIVALCHALHVRDCPPPKGRQ
jgi:hypothetical protein